MSDMLVKLYDIPDPTSFVSKLQDSGVTIRRAMAYEKHKVVNWVHEAFEIGWAGESDVAFGNKPISCYVAMRDADIVGFACYESTYKDYFGPLGVVEAERKQGIGRALLLACLQAMAEAGYAYAIIGGGGSGPSKFYEDAAGAVKIEGSTPGIYR